MNSNLFEILLEVVRKRKTHGLFLRAFLRRLPRAIGYGKGCLKRNEQAHLKALPSWTAFRPGGVGTGNGQPWNSCASFFRRTIRALRCGMGCLRCLIAHLSTFSVRRRQRTGWNPDAKGHGQCSVGSAYCPSAKMQTSSVEHILEHSCCSNRCGTRGNDRKFASGAPSPSHWLEP